MLFARPSAPLFVMAFCGATDGVSGIVGCACAFNDGAAKVMSAKASVCDGFM